MTKKQWVGAGNACRGPDQYSTAFYHEYRLTVLLTIVEELLIMVNKTLPIPDYSTHI